MRVWKLSTLWDIFIILFLARALVWVLGGIDPRALDGDDGGGTTYTAISGIIYLYSLYYIVTFAPDNPDTIKRSIVYFPFIAFCAASTSWSIDPSATIIRTSSLIGTYLVALYFAFKYHPIALMKLMGWSLFISTALSIVIAIAMPDYGVQSGGDNAGNWRGLFSHKNVASYVVIIGLITHAFLYWMERKRLWLLAVSLDIVFLIGASSRTAILCLVLTFALVKFLRFLSRRNIYTIGLSALLLVFIGGGAVFTVTNLHEILALLGRDITLTGRTTIWQAAFAFLAESPFFGHGYQAAWRTGEGMPLYMLRLGWAWNPSHAHNGFIDIMLGVGYIGFIIYVLIFFSQISRTTNVMTTGHLEGAWMLSMLLSIAIIGMSGRVIMQPNTLYSLISFYIAAASPTTAHYSGSTARPTTIRPLSFRGNNGSPK